MQDSTVQGSILKPALVIMTGRAFGVIAAFVIPIVLVRVFDQATFGTYKQLFLIYGTLYGIAQLGMAESLFYFIPAKPASAGRHACNALLGLGIAGCLGLGGLWLLRGHVAQWLNNETLADYLPLIAVYLLFMLLSALLEIVMTARKRHVLTATAYAVSDCSRASLYLAPAFITEELRWLLYGAIAFAIARFAVTLGYLRTEFRGGLVPDVTTGRRQLLYALPFSLAVLIEMVQANLHLFVVSHNVSAAEFAIYAIGCLQIPVAELLMASTGNVMMVRMKEVLNRKGSSVVAIWNDTTRKMALLVFPLVGGLMLLAPELIELLFTSDYLESVPVFSVWVSIFLLSALLTDAALRVYAEVRFLVAMNLVRLLVVVLLINVLMNALGLPGAVLATVLATLAAKAVALARIRRRMRVGIRELLPWRSLVIIILIAGLAVLPALAVKSVITPLLPRLLSAGAVYSISYLALLMLFGPLDDDEKDRLIGWVCRPVSRATGRPKTLDGN